MRRLWSCTFLLIVALTGGLATSASAAPYDTVSIEPTKTSIYVGSVSLTMTPFQREKGVFSADYRAKVFPYFFSNEHGRLWVEFSDEQVARLDRGERVAFQGRAVNHENDARRIEGHATPASPGARNGRIKVRVFVTPKIELIFNTTYRSASE